MSIILSILLVLLAICDVVLTNKIIALGGYERNPIMRFFMDRLGVFWWAPKIVLISTVAAVCIALPYGEIYIITMSAVQAYIDYGNLDVYRKLKGR